MIAKGVQKSLRTIAKQLKCNRKANVKQRKSDYKGATKQNQRDCKAIVDKTIVAFEHFKVISISKRKLSDRKAFKRE
jgi:hypothetical protein